MKALIPIGNSSTLICENVVHVTIDFRKLRMSSMYITSVHNTSIALLFHYLGRLEKWIPRVELISLNVAIYIFNFEPAILNFLHS